MVRCRRKYYLESCPWHFLVPNLVLFKTKTFKGARLTAVCNRWSLTSINGGGGYISNGTQTWHFWHHGSVWFQYSRSKNKTFTFNFIKQCNPTAQKTYIKHFYYRKLQTYLSPSIHSKNAQTSCLFSIRYHCFFHRTTNWMLTRQVSGVAIQLRLRFSQSLKPYELHKLIPNYQSSFCWIYLLLLTLSIIRSSCPPSHHWTSQGFHFACLNLTRRSFEVTWEGRYPKHMDFVSQHWSLGFLKDQFLDHSSSPHTLHHWVPSYKHMVSPTISMLMTHSCISHFDLMIQQ